MPKFNTNFDLNVRDLDLIENALRVRKKELSLQRLAVLSSTSDADAASLADVNAALNDTHDLLGRLHNQKVFYRPARSPAKPYVSG